MELFSTCLPTVIWQVGDHAEAKISATCVVVDVSKHLDILSLIFKLKRWSVLHFHLGIFADTASAACPAHPGTLTMTSHHFCGRHL